MNKKLIFIIATVIIIGTCISLYAFNSFEVSAAGPMGSAVVKHDSVILDGNKLQIATLYYDGQIWVPLIDICHVFNLELKYENGKSINAISSAKIGKVDSEKLISLGSNKTVYAYKDDSNIKFDGINSYLDSVKCSNNIFVPLNYFAEQYNKRVVWDQKAGIIKISGNQPKYIGKVNGEHLTEKELNYFFIPQCLLLENIKYTDSKNKKIDLDLKRKEAMDTIVQRKIISWKVREYGLTFDGRDAEAFNAQLDEVVEANNGIKSLRESAYKYGSTFSQMVQVFKEDYMRDKLKKFLFSGIKAADEQVSQYYNDHRDIMYRPAQVRVKQIMLKIPRQNDGSIDTAAKDEKKKVIDNIKEQLNGGADFDKLMGKYTEDTAYKKFPQGYLLDTSSTADAVGKAAFSMEAGQISQVVETVNGFYILRLEEKIPEKQLSFDEAKEYIRKRLESIETDEKWNELLEKWRIQSKIVVQFP